MKHYLRLMLGKQSIYAADCFAHNYIGVDFGINEDLTGKLPEDWRTFNKQFSPKFIENNPDKTKIAAGLACGALWTVAKYLCEGDMQATTTEIFKQDGKLIEKLKYVAKYIDGDNINSDTLNYYFDITKVEDEFPENPIRFGFPVSDSIDVLLPYQFGWLHYIDRIDNEIEHPGLGYSFAYNAPFTKATIYIYNLEHQRIDYVETSSLFEAHLDDISNQIMQSNPQTSFFNEFKYNNYVYRAYLIGGQHSAVLLGVIDNHFCKVRITTMHPDEKYEFECMMESIGYLSSIFNRS